MTFIYKKHSSVIQTTYRVGQKLDHFKKEGVPYIKMFRSL